VLERQGKRGEILRLSAEDLGELEIIFGLLVFD